MNNMNSDMSRDDRNKYAEMALKQTKEYSRVEDESKRMVVEILNTCEGKRMAFTDADDDDEQFGVVVTNESGTAEEYRLVDDVALKETNDGDSVVVITDDCHDEWQLWEIHAMTYTGLLAHLANELVLEQSDRD
jgi:hypothetical protein